MISTSPWLTHGRYAVERVDWGDVELFAIMQTRGCTPLTSAGDILWAGETGVMWSYSQLFRQGAAAP